MRGLRMLAAVALLAACDDEPTAVRTTVDGTWTGRANRTSMDVRLVQSGTRVSGNGTFTDERGPDAITVDGTYAAPVITLTILFPNTTFNPITLSGALAPSGASIDARLNGSGYDNFALPLFRQR